MALQVPPLPYDYDALEPTIDAATMRLHHDKHHRKAPDQRPLEPALPLLCARRPPACSRESDRDLDVELAAVLNPPRNSNTYALDRKCLASRRATPIPSRQGT